jgi:hypothetical protein
LKDNTVSSGTAFVTIDFFYTHIVPNGTYGFQIDTTDLLFTVVPDLLLPDQRFFNLIFPGHLNDGFSQYCLDFSQGLDGKIVGAGHPFADLTFALAQKQSQILSPLSLLYQDFMDAINYFKGLSDGDVNILRDALSSLFEPFIFYHLFIQLQC